MKLHLEGDGRVGRDDPPHVLLFGGFRGGGLCGGGGFCGGVHVRLAFGAAGRFGSRRRAFAAFGVGGWRRGGGGVAVAVAGAGGARIVFRVVPENGKIRHRPTRRPREWPALQLQRHRRRQHQLVRVRRAVFGQRQHIHAHLRKHHVRRVVAVHVHHDAGVRGGGGVVGVQVDATAHGAAVGQRVVAVSARFTVAVSASFFRLDGPSGVAIVVVVGSGGHPSGGGRSVITVGLRTCRLEHVLQRGFHSVPPRSFRGQYPRRVGAIACYAQQLHTAQRSLCSSPSLLPRLHRAVETRVSIHLRVLAVGARCVGSASFISRCIIVCVVHFAVVGGILAVAVTVGITTATATAVGIGIVQLRFRRELLCRLRRFRKKRVPVGLRHVQHRRALVHHSVVPLQQVVFGNAHHKHLQRPCPLLDFAVPCRHDGRGGVRSRLAVL